jgi:signal transduction histidine kinase
MKKVALVFVLAVFLPSLVLAWLAVRSLNDQQFLLERQQSLLYQGVADALSKSIQDALAEQQRDFTSKLTDLLQNRNPQDVAKSFDDLLRNEWPLAQVGFVVTLSGQILSPSPQGRTEARKFNSDNSRFLCSIESAEVFWNSKLAANNGLVANAPTQELQAQNEFRSEPKSQSPASARQQLAMNSAAQPSPAPNSLNYDASSRNLNSKVQSRKVMPQQQASSFQKDTKNEDAQQSYSKVASSEAEFRQLIGDATEGTIARFVDNKLNVLFWSRSPPDSQFIFGVQVSLPELIRELKPLLDQIEPALREEICVALLDDNAKPVGVSHAGFQTNWKRPFVATEIGETLPHWEVAVYLLDPAKLTNSARTLKLTLGLLISVLILAIAVGSWLIVADLNRQLKLARQKTDFVSNVSHELKTPLTSIRMFSELLAENRVSDPAKQRSYLGIISAEAARLTRLINNVLDFARLERGEKKYRLEPCDLVRVVRETAETYRPHLETNGFKFDCQFPASPLQVQGDCDALAQIIVNLLSNAEKYSNSHKEIGLRVESSSDSRVEVKVLDRGSGVPKGCEEKIFEQFYRAHDSLSSGIQGSGLGLTLARQIARAHHGDILYEPRPEGGSCFTLRLPLAESPTQA